MNAIREEEDAAAEEAEEMEEEEEAEKEEEAEEACRGRHRARQGIAWQCHLPFWQAPQCPRQNPPFPTHPPHPQSLQRSSSPRPRAEAGA
jgi:hypothetical protein